MHQVVYDKESRLRRDILAVVVVWWGKLNFKGEKRVKFDGTPYVHHTEGQTDVEVEIVM